MYLNPYCRSSESVISSLFTLHGNGGGFQFCFTLVSHTLPLQGETGATRRISQLVFFFQYGLLECQVAQWDVSCIAVYCMINMLKPIQNTAINSYSTTKPHTHTTQEMKMFLCSDAGKQIHSPEEVIGSLKYSGMASPV